jgi:iron complex outermembrane receptor protein
LAGILRGSHFLKCLSAGIALALTTAAPGVRAQAAGEQQLPEVRVGDRRDQEVVVREAPGVLRSDVPLRDIPASVKVIPRAVIDEQQALRLDQALRNVPGVIFTDGGEGTNFTSRGFGLTMLRDGFRRTEFTEGDVNRADQDTFNIDRIEVVKGPASALFGRSNAGGLVNIVTKRPQPAPLGTLAVTAGSFDLRRATIDVGGALHASQGFAGRVNAAYEESNSFRDFVDSRREMAAPSFTWRIDHTLSVTLFGESISVTETPDVGLPRQGNRIVPGLPFSRFLGEPSTDRTKADVNEARLLIEKQAGNWLLRAALLKGTIEGSDFFTRGGALQADGRTLTRTIIDSVFDSNDEMAQLEAIGKLDFAGITHRLTVGVDAGTRKTDSVFNSAPAQPIDIFDPVYGRTGPTGPFSRFRQVLKQEALGAFVHDNLRLSEHWKLAVGLRFDRFRQGPAAGHPGNLPDREYERASPRAGIVFQPVPYVSWYAAYDRSFQTPNGFPLQADGTPLGPQKSILKETGVKTEWLDGRVVASTAIYRITRTNVGTPDLQNPGFQIAIGEQESEGFELDLSGEVLPGWKVLGAYGYTDAHITRANDRTQGRIPPNVPRHALSLWTSYELQSGDLRGLGFGAGAYYLSERQGDANNTFQVPGYTRMDAALFYKAKAWTARLNAYNMADRDILLNPTRAPFFKPDAPRHFLATVEWKFL